MAVFKQSSLYFKTLLVRAPVGTILSLTLAVVLTYFLYETTETIRTTLIITGRRWPGNVNFFQALWWVIAFFLYLTYFSFLYATLSQPAFFLWTEGRVPFWRLLFNIFKKGARTFKMFFLLLRASLHACIAPAVFVFMYYEYFTANSSSLTMYLFLAVAIIVSGIIFWRNATLFSTLFAVSTLDVTPRQSLYQIPAYVALYQNPIAILIALVVGLSTAVALMPAYILRAPELMRLSSVFTLALLWVALTALAHTLLHAMSLSHDSRQQADPVSQLREALMSFVKNRQKQQQQYYEEEISVETYTVTNVTVEDEE